ncbi:SpoIVB peptidase [Fictibacillus barbaricus]|uniref:Stage IV sporulation protein B n=1 Tax=Fictibacillus barbaricus TaxID=182136 RepID=A0ABU1TZP2_9BACL|nr:SpoIVB peptidase [Fictibacillus barbaricus]MDR7072672.1 stage IV sporulation protein B [Fictibacillus barbaricus]
MYRDFLRRMIGVILLGSLLGIGFLSPVQDYVKMPDSITVFEGQNVKQTIPAGTKLQQEQRDLYTTEMESSKVVSIKAKKYGDNMATLEASSFPIKKMNVKVLSEFKVIPGGQSIGVKLNTLGVLIVGHHLVNTAEGKRSPGEIADIQIGDIITKINGKSIQKMGDVSPFVRESGERSQPLDVTIIRNGKTVHKTLTPLQDKNDHSYRIGLYIRDSAAGVGTLTFYDPSSYKYGALGHVISDMDTKQPIKVNKGEILGSTVTSIEKGSNGHPGEKLARFSEDQKILGDINKNSPFGIFGTLNQKLSNGGWNKPLPIALSDQVKEGPAKILTVVDGSKVREFDVDVVSSVPQKFPATKGMVIKITDPELLKITGGIVQGMSGSPIIQNGRIIGAVTHVFVNDPTSGYGVHIEWMLDEAGINIYEEKKQAS